MSRSMVKLIHADNFFEETEAENLRNAVKDMPFVQKSYGFEMENFNMIFNDIELTFNKVLGERVMVDPIRSGVIRKPFNNAIHFESFDSVDEWCFFVALEPTTINLWAHISESQLGELSSINSASVLEGAKFNYQNFFEWKVQCNILLEQNQGIFIRPWMFHSLESGMVQYYRLITDNKYRILVMGFPESKKKSIAKKLAEKYEDSALLESAVERKKFKTIDYSYNGQLRHCRRMLKLARQTRKAVTIIDMVCPYEIMRQTLNPDIIVWVSDKTESKYGSLNEEYQIPKMFDVECTDDSEESIDNVMNKISSKRI